MVALTLNDVSKHLTKDVMEKAFTFKTNDKAKYFEVTRAAPAGEGLIGAVYRIRITGQKKTTTLIVKGLVRDLLLRKSLDCPKYFVREAFFFSKILPTLMELELELGAKQSIQNKVPICYGCFLDGKNDFIIMEDFSESNCVGISSNLNKYERDGCLKTLAHFHAVSMVLRIKKPKVFAKFADELPEIYYNEENREWYKRYLQCAIDIDKNIINELEDPKSIYYKKFYELVDNDVYSQLIEMVSTPSIHAVINHGDAWYSNFLCSEDRAVAVDFQTIRFASPATDLTYFIILCGNHCNTKEDFIDAIEVYYKCFDSHMKDLGLNANKVFSKEDLMSELKLFGKFGLLATLTSIPLLSSERCDVLKSFDDKFIGIEKIPLERIWELTPIKREDQKMRLVNAVRVTVDMGLI